MTFWTKLFLGLSALGLALNVASANAYAQGGFTPIPAIGSQQSAGPATGSQNVQLALLAEATTVTPGQRLHVGLKQTIRRGWHTYWRNPGDSGEPTVMKWTLPDGVTAGEIKWPTPSAIPFGPLVNYGFSDQVILPVEITMPADAKVGSSLKLLVNATWLECEEICIPGEGQAEITLNVASASVPSPDVRTLKTALDALPKPLPEGATALLTDLGETSLQLVVRGLDPQGGAYFFPYELKIGALIDFAQDQKLVLGKDGFGVDLVKSGSFPQDLSGPVRGVLVLGRGNRAEAYVVDAAYSPAAAGTSPAIAGASLPGAILQSEGKTSIGLMTAIGFAFLGGLILNLMPCVFPILSMKALSLTQAADGDRTHARAHGLWYALGVVSSFMILAGLLIGLQASGQAVGWGFQLQEPIVVIGLATLMFLIGLNLLGLFEIGTSLQSVGAHRTQGKSATNAVWTGVLAVLVAAPCTAPFMGAALGFASTQSPPVALGVFGALGLGFAAPFVILTFSPGLMKHLPRPGVWMQRFKEFLAFPMLATAVWLIWVVSAQAGQTGVLAALICLLLAGFGVWLWRVASVNIRAPLAFSVLFLALCSAVWLLQTRQGEQAQTTDQAQSAAIDGEPWSPERVSQLTLEGRTVFVNFTADWCVTCKVNEAVVFGRADVASQFGPGNAAYLVADWTNRDALIAAALGEHGRVGVPLYLVYKPGRPQPEILPQILTPGILDKALRSGS